MNVGGTIPLVESQLNTKKKMRLGLVSHEGDLESTLSTCQKGGVGRERRRKWVQHKYSSLCFLTVDVMQSATSHYWCQDFSAMMECVPLKPCATNKSFLPEVDFFRYLFTTPKITNTCIFCRVKTQYWPSLPTSPPQKKPHSGCHIGSKESLEAVIRPFGALIWYCPFSTTIRNIFLLTVHKSQNVWHFVIAAGTKSCSWAVQWDDLCKVLSLCVFAV